MLENNLKSILIKIFKKLNPNTLLKILKKIFFIKTIFLYMKFNSLEKQALNDFLFLKNLNFSIFKEPYQKNTFTKTFKKIFFTKNFKNSIDFFNFKNPFYRGLNAFV
ncbi:hypothetical protein [Helicobacter cetorum]|uniref:Uncharacterized protein n=1 Tax=Helicobacter cetorum (strain ATCC BAA-540 / CCUG 52418 / MIT 99-5656) TaxID=1163745 RepID=I0ESI1_HELCM|nr:hypothetical protein [Helicobacter cetorum]AFI05900.1 hypothetical protein HCD_04430 [Helicobacter cetorum MIT 99-5656]